ncbi:YaaR family protein [Romboutsia sp.]|uniref:YaaR family protein n=1 Tax=Romboutsia sp. TaxID=1965302 RepID=UPI003F39FF46
MKVGNVGIGANLSIDNKNVKSKLDFNDSFNQTNRAKTKEELDAYIKEIKKTGERLVVTQDYTDVLKYKQAIKGYLKSIVDYVYTLNKNDSFWDSNHFTTVKTVNEKLDELTKSLLYDEKENLDVAAQIDEINGLLIDIYV